MRKYVTLGRLQIVVGQRFLKRIDLLANTSEQSHSTEHTSITGISWQQSMKQKRVLFVDSPYFLKMLHTFYIQMLHTFALS